MFESKQAETERFFSGCSTPEEVKKLYRELAFLHHPDHGGDTATMQAVNEQYHEALENLDGYKTYESGKVRHTYHYRHSTEQAVVDKINDLLQAKLKGVDMWLIGVWIWVSGDTKPNSKALKKLKFRWHSKRLSWYWKPYARRTRYSGASMDSLAQKYGARFIRPEEEKSEARREERPPAAIPGQLWA